MNRISAALKILWTGKPETVKQYIHVEKKVEVVKEKVVLGDVMYTNLYAVTLPTGKLVERSTQYGFGGEVSKYMEPEYRKAYFLSCEEAHSAAEKAKWPENGGRVSDFMAKSVLKTKALRIGDAYLISPDNYNLVQAESDKECTSC